MTFEEYLIDVSIRSVEDFLYTDDEITENIDHFKDCFESGISAYKALTFLIFYMDEKRGNEKMPGD